MPDSVTTIFQRSSNGQVTIRYSEKVDSNGDSTLSVDVDMPEATDLDIDLEYSMQSQGQDILRLCDSCPSQCMHPQYVSTCNCSWRTTSWLFPSC